MTKTAAGPQRAPPTERRRAAAAERSGSALLACSAALASAHGSDRRDLQRDPAVLVRRAHEHLVDQPTLRRETSQAIPQRALLVDDFTHERLDDLHVAVAVFVEERGAFAGPVLVAL